MKFFLYNDQSIICMILVNTGGSRGSADMCPPLPNGTRKVPASEVGTSNGAASRQREIWTCHCLINK